MFRRIWQGFLMGVVVGIVLSMLVAAILPFRVINPIDPRLWISIWGYFGAFVGVITNLGFQIRKEGKEHQLFLNFRNTFLGSSLVQDAVVDKLHRLAVECDEASKNIITLQQGGLKAFAPMDLVGYRDYDQVLERFTQLFKTAQANFYDAYHLAKAVSEVSNYWSLRLRGRNFKAYLNKENPPVPNDVNDYPESRKV